MAAYDLSALTSAQLTTLQGNLLDTINRSTNAQAYTAGGGRSLERMSPQAAMEMLSAVNREISARSDTGGDALILVDFEDPL